MQADERTRSLAAQSGTESPDETPEVVLRRVYDALAEKGYDPIHQLVGYLISGDPAYITSHRGARAAIRKVGRDELLEELVRDFVQRVAR